MDCSPSGSSVHGVLQARILETVSMLFSRVSSLDPRDWTWVSCIVGRFFTIWATREALYTLKGSVTLWHPAGGAALNRLLFPMWIPPKAPATHRIKMQIPFLVGNDWPLRGSLIMSSSLEPTNMLLHVVACGIKDHISQQKNRYPARWLGMLFSSVWIHQMDCSDVSSDSGPPGYLGPLSFGVLSGTGSLHPGDPLVLRGQKSPEGLLTYHSLSFHSISRSLFLRCKLRSIQPVTRNCLFRKRQASFVVHLLQRS